MTAIALVSAVLLLEVAVPYLYYTTYVASRPEGFVFDGVEVRSTSVDVTGLNGKGVGLSLAAVVYNPNSVGATLEMANYSVYVDGHYVGNGQTAKEYDIAPTSTETLVFPIVVGWQSALRTTGYYFAALGKVTLEVKGTASVKALGIALTAPFQLTAG